MSAQALSAPGARASAVPIIERSTACPLCHTAGPALGDDRLQPGMGWRCAVCHQAWDMTRLATVAAYLVYAADRAGAQAPGTSGARFRVAATQMGSA
jgi:hypothetical protein